MLKSFSEYIFVKTMGTMCLMNDNGRNDNICPIDIRTPTLSTSHAFLVRY